MYRIVPLTPELIPAWHEVVAATAAHDLPGEPLPTPEQVHAQLTTPGLNSRRAAWLALTPGGDAAGVAALRLFDAEGQAHLCELEVRVRPERRREGAGSLLLEAAVSAADGERRRSMIGVAADPGPGAEFCAARGFDRVLTFSNLLLDVTGADLDVAAPEGYEAVMWQGTVPDELAEAFAAAKNAMNDMPTGKMDYGVQRWDADRVRSMAKVLADRGDTLLTVAARRGGELAGFTEIVIRSGETRRALQYDTVVVPAHRGHGVGLWLKAEMVGWLRAERPGIAEVETDNADDNTHMLAVNNRLGFRLHRRSSEFQLSLRS
ncbi:GNAT family N-acetyltransferase [Nonomuraea soli]|uniref:GNAT superfamily N-acetyltransferase n=1 Tax=Nonomuraea soli TaxID=1032476 RepID=A0A7W0CDL3_9ACTN|nr:GNAT family N-acetyltransferase [Nonomuraea soli]MBA2889171.1 GNAT superfamily N-acetyltransferase [Nonomuraea soli]